MMKSQNEITGLEQSGKGEVNHIGQIGKGGMDLLGQIGVRREPHWTDWQKWNDLFGK